jgi:hypothetical protein
VIVNPADTWSNLAYIAFGLWMMREARRGGRRDLALFGPASIAVGVFSGAYHASYTWMLQFFDFVGMFLFCFLASWSWSDKRPCYGDAKGAGRRTGTTSEPWRYRLQPPSARCST